MRLILVVCGVLAVASLNASAASPVRVAFSGGRPSATVGQAWMAGLAVSPRSYRGVVTVVATGQRRLVVRATRAGRTYRVRLVFPAAGRWQLTARAAGKTSRLGAVTVNRPAPLRFTWPTSVDAQPDGSLLVVENGRGRVVVVQPARGDVRTLATGLAKPYAAVRAPSGSVFVSDGPTLKRIDGAGAPETVTTAADDVGPLAVAPSGAVFYAAGTRLFRLPPGAGTPQVVTGGLSNPHGLAVAPDGAVLVSDTGNDRVLRVVPDGGAAATLIRTVQPRGIDVAGDGTIYLVEAGARRVGRYDAGGTRGGAVGPAYGDPYDVVAGGSGVVYVVDTAASGTIWRVGADGKALTIPTG